MEENKNSEYNDIPVAYCKNCLSLKIMTLDNYDFCDTCGSMDVGETDIETWDKMYQEKYKHKFIENERKRSYYKWAGPAN